MAFSTRMRRIPLQNIRLTDKFWSRWQKVIGEVTIEAEWKQIVETGRLQNLINAANKAAPIPAGSGPALCDQSAGVASEEEAGFKGYFFNDSDIYKWCEAAGYVLAQGANPQVKKRLDEAIAAIAAAQEPSGYIDTFFQLRHPHLKWRNLLAMHEMYCMGHLIEAGVAVAEAGDRRLLNIAIKAADHIMSVFGPGKRRGYCGHQEIELALLRLAAATGNKKYREFARWMIEERGKRPTVFEQELSDDEAMALSPWANRQLRKDGDYSGEYAQDHAPIREHTEVVGHAVRAMYFYIAATQLAEGDDELQRAIERIWNNLTRKRMYLTGGIGPSSSNEGFTGDYDLPNLTAYAETCAAIGLVFWGQALLEATGSSEYADIVERALYNGTISGMSLSGDKFFYTNPLESRGNHDRTPWFDCACCPPNIARMIGSLGWYVASVSDNAFWIHIPAGFEATTTIAGTQVKITCESEYPWKGNFVVRVDPESPAEFELRLRIPEWADEVDTELPGLGKQSAWESGYAVFSKRWERGDVLTVDLGMQPKWVECDPRVRDNLGRVALTRGPLVYCAEEHDLGYAPQLFVADTETPIELVEERILEGITSISVEGFADQDAFVDDLYSAEGTVETGETVAKLVPYYAWCNRGANSMQVWLRRA